MENPILNKLGFFGGTFDPVHLGHINVCRELIELKAVDEIILTPAIHAPLKNDEPKASYIHRLNMLKLAFENDSAVSIEQLEKSSKSYTIDTLEVLQKKYPDRQIRLIIGSDQAEQFHLWKDYKTILENFKPIVVNRKPNTLEQGWDFIKIPLMEISSTEIRRRIINNLKIDHLVPPKIVDYIYLHHLYCLNFKDQ